MNFEQILNLNKNWIRTEILNMNKIGFEQILNLNKKLNLNKFWIWTKISESEQNSIWTNFDYEQNFRMWKKNCIVIKIRIW
jgi:hypothetical protein